MIVLIYIYIYREGTTYLLIDILIQFEYIIHLELVTLDHFKSHTVLSFFIGNQQSDLHRTRTRKLIRTFLVFMNIYNSHSTIEKTTSVYCLVFVLWKYEKMNHVIKKNKTCSC